MNAAEGIPLVLLAAGLLVFGIALGAASQKETFLGNDLEDDPTSSGTLTFLTAILVGMGAFLLAIALGSGGAWYRFTGAGTIGLAAWALVSMVQTAFPNYNALPEFGVASITQSTLLVDEVGATTVLLPLLAMGLGAVLAIAWGIRRVMWTATGPAPSAMALRRRHLGLMALCVPFMLVTAFGSIRFMMELPDDEPGVGLLFVLLPMAAVACAVLVTTVMMRGWHIMGLRNDPRILPFTQEAWRGLARIDLVALILLAVIAALSTALPGTASEATTVGRTWVFTYRSHGQALMFLAIPLLALHLHHQDMGRRMTGTDWSMVSPNTGLATRQFWIMAVAATVALVACLSATFGTRSALLPWAMTFLPMAIAAAIASDAWSSAGVRILSAWTLWGLGNTITASYAADSFPDLEFATHPGVLALWRMLAAGLLAWWVHDAMRELAHKEKLQVAVPLAVATAVSVSIVGLMELPLAVWAESTLPADKVALGSLIESQQTGVQAMMHILAVIATFAATISLARVLHPEWFRRRGHPVDVQTTLDQTTPG